MLNDMIQLKSSFCVRFILSTPRLDNTRELLRSSILRSSVYVIILPQSARIVQPDLSYQILIVVAPTLTVRNKLWNRDIDGILVFGFCLLQGFSRHLQNATSHWPTQPVLELLSRILLRTLPHLTCSGICICH